jgi:predicted transcriptional regulator
MTVKEELHRLIDHLPEERLELVRELIADLEDRQSELDETPLSQSEIASIRRSLEDIKAGRTVSFDEIKRENGL